MEYTKGIKLHYDNKDLHEGLITENDNGNQNQVAMILPQFRDYYGKFIVTAVNSCIEVNPDNPQAVAESIPALYKALKECLALLDKQREEYNSALSVLPRPKADEGPIAKKTRKALALTEGRTP